MRFLAFKPRPSNDASSVTQTTNPEGGLPVIRRKRNILEMAVATALFSACAAGAMPASHAAQAASTTNDTGAQAASQPADQDQTNGKSQVANANLLQEVVISGFVSSIQNSIVIQKNSDSIDEV